MWYFERALDGEYGPGIKVEQGQSIETGPLLVHQCWFPVNTVLISCSRNPRNHEAHEADVVRVEEEWLKP